MNMTANSGKEVISKYFAQSKFGMDDSLSEFKKPKASCIASKTTQVAQKPSTSKKTVAKKRIKKIKGQKDIRSVLSKKNELEAYARDFDNICQKSGIDVDSEQLQLAIALSKSLCDSKSCEASDSEISQPLTSKERNVKIRTTLQEYGFKVPDVKKKVLRKKRIEDFRKESKLLLRTEAERQQVIADRYSQIIFESVISRNGKDNKLIEDIQSVNNIPVYHIATNTLYDCLKKDEVYYVDNLIDITPNSVGSLLRDWSKIPGRPASPVLKHPIHLKLSHLDLKMEELDVILSGPIDEGQEIIKRKLTEADNNRVIENTNYVTEVIEISNSPTTETLTIDTYKNDALHIITPSVRCASPDLFDDDFSSTDNAKDSNIFSSQKSSQVHVNCLSQSKTVSSQNNITRKKSNDFMDLTECVNNLPPNASSIASSVLVEGNEQVSGENNSHLSSQNLFCTDITKRKSNDLMEITDCVLANPSHTIQINDVNIDLTQGVSGREEHYDTIVIVDPNETENKCDLQSLDLTQSSNSNDDSLPFVHISGLSQRKVTLEDNKDVDQINHSILEDINNRSKECELFQEYVFEHSDHDSSEAKKCEITKNSNKNQTNDVNSECIYKLRQADFSEEKISVCEKDLIEQDLSNLGKKNDVSIDYDEIVCNDSNYNKNVDENSILQEDCKEINSEDTIKDFRSHGNKDVVEIESYNFIDENRSSGTRFLVSETHLQVFEISNEELHYSIHQSRCNKSQDDSMLHEIPNDIFEFDGISILDNISSNLEKSKTNNDEVINNARISNANDDCFLPVVDIKRMKVKMNSPKRKSVSAPSTPMKELVTVNFTAVNTPKNSEYLIKTSEVTPMLDYESMTTPNRNKELDKYGLKPFKRKRAIQLLTHLYNQTHPIVDANDLESPSKKRKPDLTQKSSANNCDGSLHSKVPESISSKSVNSNLDEINIENVACEENCVQNLKEVECATEDWVFQKREKAKVHSCRVPLHIAFYNYVNSRRGLQEAILRYDPVNIDVIHADLVGYGHRYDPKDLLKFLDKKCITVKTADNNSRNVKNIQKKS